MTITDEQIGEQLRGELAGASPTIDVDAVMERGARRVRRRTAAKVGGVAAATALVVTGALAVNGTWAKDAQAPAPGSTGVHVEQGDFAGCTLKPTTCDARIPQAWIKKHLGQTGPAKFTLGNGGPDELYLGQLPLGRTATWRVPNGITSVIVSQRLTIDEEPMSYGPKRTVVLDPGVTARVFLGNEIGNPIDEWWLVKERSGHGAVSVFLSYSTGKRTWTDADVKALINQLLDTPPRSGGTDGP